MPEAVDWLPDGTPYSPRFGDRYHSENSLGQARSTFLQGCGLPAAWAGLSQWRILETGFGFGLNFLATWAAWRADPERPTLLHFVSTEAWPVSADNLLRATARHTELAPMAQELHRQWWGLLPGVHRLRFDEGHVLLTLCIGDTQAQLRRQALTVDAVYLDGFSPQHNPDIWSLDTLKAVARCCRRGTRLATWSIARSVRDHLVQCGFEVERVPGVPPKRHNLQAVYNPRWEPRTAKRQAAASTESARPGECLVVGAGIAGAAVAASLARRGWKVCVLDQARMPAGGASGLPAGVFAPHVSPDDSVLSRLSRSGVRATLEQAGWLLHEGVDWALSGVLEHRTDGTAGLAAGWEHGPGADWSHRAPSAILSQALLPADAVTCWHPKGGWVRPARMVSALLAQPGIRWQGGCPVARLRRVEESGEWQALDGQGQVLAHAATVVIAAGAGSADLLEHRWPLQPVRGQVSWGSPAASPLPGHGALPMRFPVNGNGNLVPCFPMEADPQGTSAWVMGSTFERGTDILPPPPADVQAAHAANWDKLRTLLPQAAMQLQPAFDSTLAGPLDDAHRIHSWAAVRCTSPDRLPVVGPVDTVGLPGLWACTAMGARGLTLALLCGELLAARLQGEPLPVDAKLARALGAERLQP